MKEKIKIKATCVYYILIIGNIKCLRTSKFLIIDINLIYKGTQKYGTTFFFIKINSNFVL